MKTPWDSVEAPATEKQEKKSGKEMPFAKRVKALKGKLGKKPSPFAKNLLVRSGK